MLKIAVVLGSIRLQRQSEKPAHYIAELLRQRQGVQVDFIDLRVLDLPLFNDEPTGPVQEWKQRVLAADGLIFVFPEYNYLPSSAMKSALDWLRHYELSGKPVSLVTVSDGQFGGARALFAMRGTLPTFRCLLLPTAVMLPRVQDLFPDERTLISQSKKEELEHLLDEHLEWVQRLVATKKSLL